MIEWEQSKVHFGLYYTGLYVREAETLRLTVAPARRGHYWALVSSVGERHTNELLVDKTCADLESAKKRAVELAREVVRELAKELEDP